MPGKSDAAIEGRGPDRAWIDAAPSCKLCGAATAFAFERRGFGVFRCASCGFRFALIPEGFPLESVYNEEEYWSGSPIGHDRPYEEVTAAAADLFGRRLNMINRLATRGRLLDIGCADGYALTRAKDCGWAVAGVELSEMMRRRCAEKLGQPVYGSLDEVVAAGVRFNAVSLFEVIEHLPDPVAELKRIAGVMEPDGLLALSTPNFESYGAEIGAPTSVWFEPPAHINYFGPATLRDCLRRGGFRVVESDPLMRPEAPLPPLVATLLRPFRKGKRLMPHGFLGRLIKAWQRRQPNALYWSDYLVFYARKES